MVCQLGLGHPRLELRSPRPKAVGLGRKTQARQEPLSTAAGGGEGTKVTGLFTASSWLRVIAAETVFLFYVNGLRYFFFLVMFLMFHPLRLSLSHVLHSAHTTQGSSILKGVFYFYFCI